MLLKPRSFGARKDWKVSKKGAKNPNSFGWPSFLIVSLFRGHPAIKLWIVWRLFNGIGEWQSTGLVNQLSGA